MFKFFAFQSSVRLCRKGTKTKSAGARSAELVIFNLPSGKTDEIVESK